MYPYSPNLNKVFQLPFHIYTKFCLSQISNHFPDFSASAFPALSIKIYSEFYQSLHKHKKSDLLKTLTFPNAEIIKIAQKSHKKLPFETYEKILNSTLVHARISSESVENSSMVNFAHITMKMSFQSADGQNKTQLNIYERRLDNKLKDSWKIGFIEDI